MLMWIGLLTMTIGIALGLYAWYRMGKQAGNRTEET